MRFSFLALAGLVAGSAVAPPPSTSVRLQIQATHQLPNPYALPPSTKATLTSFHRRHAAPISTTSQFVFHNVTPGSYLVDVHCTTHAFAPLRLDVEAPAPDSEKPQALVLKAWETYRGNDWDNKGQAVPLQNGVFEVQAVGVKNYFIERSKCKFCPLPDRIE
jgi:ER membrane protein complex subunit 7